MLVGIWSRQAAWRAKSSWLLYTSSVPTSDPFLLRSPTFLSRTSSVWLGCCRTFEKPTREERLPFFFPTYLLGRHLRFLCFFLSTKKVLLFALLLQLHLLSPFFFISLSFPLHTLPVPSLSVIILSHILGKSRGLLFLSLSSEYWSYIRL
ncbi:hypothetical protein BDV26DRAFT_131484 [Aspergillus bertholletiae]|uniref:Uncharacterized protein n=1 Tax=Aspergillus bertholletiae TaxID=1226010 RepID=A0A5N7BFN1_9EURO|nr:hypothetical protein BDV26DRAFT_131484 [Aspergillus bertholletiae]